MADKGKLIEVRLPQSARIIESVYEVKYKHPLFFWREWQIKDGFKTLESADLWIKNNDLLFFRWKIIRTDTYSI